MIPLGHGCTVRSKGVVRCGLLFSMELTLGISGVLRGKTPCLAWFAGTKLKMEKGPMETPEDPGTCTLQMVCCGPSRTADGGPRRGVRETTRSTIEHARVRKQQTLLRGTYKYALFQSRRTCVQVPSGANTESTWRSQY